MDKFLNNKFHRSSKNIRIWEDIHGKSSTFKSIRGDMSLFGVLLSFFDTKKDVINYYNKEDDSVIDNAMIENDFAVVGKDLSSVMRHHVKDCKNCA